MVNPSGSCLYECCRCKAKWSGPPDSQTHCAHCGSLYVKWVNYESWLKLPKSARFRKVYPE